MIVTPAEKKEKMLAVMDKAGVKCTIIGMIKEEDFGIMCENEAGIFEIDPPYADEIYKVVGK